MRQLYFLILVFFISIGLSLYYVKEAFDDIPIIQSSTNNNNTEVQNHIDDLISALSTNKVNTPSPTPIIPVAPISYPSPSPSGQNISSTPAPLRATPSTPDAVSSYYNVPRSSHNRIPQHPTVSASSVTSPSLAQGADWRSACPKMPDMSQYIKKDAIPCWGCTVEY